MSNDLAYAGTADISTGASEWNALQFAIRQVLGRIATCTPVTVRAVNGLRVDVQPMVHQLDGYANAIPHGVICDIPVWQYQAGSSAVVLMPKVGDQGICVFAHTDISKVKNTQAPALPDSRRRFDWADGIYLGGVFNQAPTQTITMDDATGITITAAAGMPVNIVAPGGMTVTTPELHVTGDITTGAGSKFNGKSFDTHTHSGVSTGSGTSGPPA